MSKDRFDACTEEQKRLCLHLEDYGYDVFLHEQDGRVCADVENWTNGGVDMVITLIPFGIKELRAWCDRFDIDEEIGVYRQDPDYRLHFNITRSLHDFTDWHNDLKAVIACFTEEKSEPKPLPSNPEEIIKKLQEWADDYPNWLSDRTDYARGYKAGVAQAKQAVNSIIHQS